MINPIEYLRFLQNQHDIATSNVKRIEEQMREHINRYNLNKEVRSGKEVEKASY